MVLLGLYKYLIDDLGDPRVKDDILVNTPFPILIAVFSYWYFIRKCGPKFMKDRPAYNIDRFVSIYNCIQVLWNTYIFYTGLKSLKSGFSTPGFDWFCIPLDPENTEYGDLIVHGGRWYVYNKVFDFCDTIFFILRKKERQVTHLHVYHHILMSGAGWVMVKYHPGGSGFSLAFLNVIVHMVMYTYYELTLLKYNTSWWKKYLTQMQIVQFVLVGSHSAILFFRNPCQHSYLFASLIVSQAVYMIYLFATFYIKEYGPGKAKKTVKKE